LAARLDTAPRDGVILSDPARPDWARAGRARRNCPAARRIILREDGTRGGPVQWRVRDAK